MAYDRKYFDPFDEEGIEKIADWMAPRVGSSPMYKLAMDTADAELLAVLLHQLLGEYLEYIEVEGSVRREGNLVFVSTGDEDEDEDTEPVNVSIPLSRALMLRLRGPGLY